VSLNPGTRLGVYDITAQIGEGGMGHVYRATDTRLKRQVAIKILSPSLAADADRLARFQREAEVLASLNHPHIAGIYGLEESDGVFALVMEFVDGEDLSQRLARGAIPIDEALPIAKQIAEALEAAHEQGIIHRDLKPANIKVKPDGTVKVLDFGLAKAMDDRSASLSRERGLSMSPTRSMHATQAGIILGTAAYMAPEQARGKTVDKRADIWAFGVVLFEMLTGSHPFPGEDLSHVLARVIERDPDWSALPSALSPTLGTYLRRCLVKDPRERIRDIGDVRLALTGAFETAIPNSTNPESPILKPVSAWRHPLPWAVAAAALAAAAVLMLWAPWRQTAPLRVTRATITFSSPAALTLNGSGHDIALSPDGMDLFYVGNNSTQLFVRALDALESVAIASVGGGGIRDPFVSSDGQWVGFVNGNTLSLQRVAITGGAPTTIAQVDGIVRGASWAADDWIIFATLKADTGLLRVSASGGAIDVLTRPDREHGEADHLWPEVLPGGRAVLFTITSQTGGLDTAKVVVRDLRTGAQTILVRRWQRRTLRPQRAFGLRLGGRTTGDPLRPQSARDARLGDLDAAADLDDGCGSGRFRHSQ
jgi:eukaryotic-like serine/threonine-protein kinase